MVSHTECSGGGEHDFNEGGDEADFNGEIMRSYSCSKCDVEQNEMLVQTGDWEYHDCDQNNCNNSSDGQHDWQNDGFDYSSPDKYFEEKCVYCPGSRKEWWRHKYTTYSDSNGREFHRHSA